MKKAKTVLYELKTDMRFYDEEKGQTFTVIMLFWSDGSITWVKEE